MCYQAHSIVYSLVSYLTRLCHASLDEIMRCWFSKKPDSPNFLSYLKQHTILTKHLSYTLFKLICSESFGTKISQPIKSRSKFKGFGKFLKFSFSHKWQ